MTGLLGVVIMFIYVNLLNLNIEYDGILYRSIALNFSWIKYDCI